MGTVDPESLRGFAHVPEPDAPVVTDDFNLGKEAYTYRQQLATVYKSVDHGRAWLFQAVYGDEVKFAGGNSKWCVLPRHGVHGPTR